MYRKINNRRLLIIVAVLVVALGALIVKDYFKGDRSFRKFVLTIDTAQVVSINISAGVTNSKNIKIFNDEGKWRVSDNSHNFSADPGMIKNIVNELASLKIETLAATAKASWTEFEVTDSAAIKVSVQEKGEKAATTLLIGKFTYQRPENPYDRQGKLSSYVRIAGEEETYAVQGFLRMNFVPDVNNYRNKFLTRTSSDLFSKISLDYLGDSSFILVKENKKWMIDGLPVDSVMSENYFTELEHLSGSEFADTMKHSEQPSFTLKIEGSALPNPIDIKAYKKEFAQGYLVTSSYNSEAIFNGSSQSLFTKIFKGKKSFLK